MDYIEKRKKMKKGITILEILVASTILVIIFLLITIFFARGTKTRNVITAYNEVGGVLSGIVDVISNGRKSFLGGRIIGLKDATTIDTANSLLLSYRNGSYVDVEIKSTTGTDTSIYILGRRFDTNRKVVLLSGSHFEYFYPDGTLKTDENIAPETIVLVKIILIGKSTNPGLRTMAPMRVETAIRLKNRPTF
jgi:type II secretory pathway pseudopilin PulG